MAPSALGGFTEAVGSMTSKAPSMTIELDSQFVVYRGIDDAITRHTVSGRLIVSTEVTLRPKSFTIEFSGRQKTSHIVSMDEIRAGYTGPYHHITSNKDLHSQTLDVRDNEGEPLTKISAGEHELPFSFELPGQLAETVEGVPGEGVYRRYEVKAHAVTGAFARDLKAKAKVRIIRTLSGDDWTTYGQPTSVDGTWTDKIRYSISAASRAVVYGGKILIDFELTTLAEKLEITKIIFSIVETQKIRTEPGCQDYPEMELKYWRHERDDLLQQPRSIPEDSDDIDPLLQLPMKKFSMEFDLPMSLKTCRQTNERDRYIQFKHKCQYRILMKNPDGHVSELKGFHPVYLFISPNLPLGDDDRVTNLNIRSVNLTGEEMANPPLYGEHALDAPIDPFSGIATAAPTPGVRSGHVTPGLGSGLAPLTPGPEELSNRLANIDSHRTEAEHEAEESNPGAEHLQRSIGFDMDSMSRVPSYTTAVRSPGRSQPGDATPSYDAAATMNEPTTSEIPAPAAAHIRSPLSTSTDGEES